MQLKDVGNMSNLAGLSPLAGSTLWTQQVDKIHPTQLHAFVKRLADQGKRDQAETAVAICLEEVRRSVVAGQILTPAMVGYSAPNRERMTAGELTTGLRLMGNARAAAVLFALETGMELHEAGRITWGSAMKMFQAATLTPLAIACTRMCPRQLRFQYVFWELDPELNMPKPLLSLDADVFDAFGMIWAELVDLYGRIILIDGSSDLAVFQATIARVIGLPADRIFPPLGNDRLGPANSAG